MQNLLNRPDSLPETSSERPVDVSSDISSVEEIVPAQPEPIISHEVMLPALRNLMAYVQKHRYEGADPFDGLNSRVLKFLPFSENRLFRLAILQSCKRSSVNLRPFLGVPSGFNPKGGALFLMGYIHLWHASQEESCQHQAKELFERLVKLALPQPKGVGWGYHFDWQARAFFAPQGTPNLVTSVYVGQALLAYGEAFDEPKAFQLAVGIAEFLLSGMIQWENKHFLCFHYIPGQDAEVHNANLLGAAYLSQVLPHLPQQQQAWTREKILKATRFSVKDIQPDGSWPYGSKTFHRWVDNFHTAFNMESLLSITQCLKTDEFIPDLQKVSDYYWANLFTAEGLPKYYNNKLYPIDIHVIAEVLVLLQKIRTQKPHEQHESLSFPDLSRIENQLETLIQQFQAPQGYFYYQCLGPNRWNKIPYMRWGQGWMFYALCSCLNTHEYQP